MGRWSNYPTTVDSLRTIEISLLKKHGYLKPDNKFSGTIIWTSSNGDKNTIGITVTTTADSGIITLNYTHNSKDKINYNIRLEARPSNLGKGFIWYFVCPQTGKYCRKLYLYSGYFLHRSAFGLMYESQIENKRMRCCSKLGKYYREEPFLKMHEKHFKKYYKGRPTKRYYQLNKLINQAERQETVFYQMLAGMKRRAGIE